MGSKRAEMVGLVFGRLTVLEYVPVDLKRAHWRCRCECGKLTTISGKNLRNGNTQSCGCYKRELNRTLPITHGDTIHGITREYRAWAAAKTRCYNPRSTSFKDYGGRGIVMCEHWRNSYAMFLLDMGRCPYGHTLERMNNDGPYSPDNCRWATRRKQANNSRRNHYLKYNGETLTIAEWAIRIGWPIDTLKRRILLGWTDERALTQPLRQRQAKK